MTVPKSSSSSASKEESTARRSAARHYRSPQLPCHLLRYVRQHGNITQTQTKPSAPPGAPSRPASHLAPHSSRLLAAQWGHFCAGATVSFAPESSPRPTSTQVVPKHSTPYTAGLMDSPMRPAYRVVSTPSLLLLSAPRRNHSARHSSLVGLRVASRPGIRSQSRGRGRGRLRTCTCTSRHSAVSCLPASSVASLAVGWLRTRR